MQNIFVLVTGCDSGFGARLVQLLRDETAFSIFACYHSNLCADSFTPDSRVVRLVADITNDQSVDLLLNSVDSILKSEDGVLFGLVNNAGGLLSSGPIEWASVELHRKQMDLNFLGAVRISKAFLPHIRQSRGRMVNVSSILGLVASPFGGVYAASKYALEGWSDALRREMLPFGVHVCLIEPGMFKSTRFYQKYTVPVSDGWSSFSEEGRDAYGPHYPKYVESRLVGLLQALGSSNVDAPVRAMMHALTARRPKLRYREGFDCVYLARILQCLPSQLADLAMVVGDIFLTGRLAMLPHTPPGRSVFQLICFTLFSYSLSSVLACVIVTLGVALLVNVVL